MSQAHSLRNMSRARTPHHRILERFFQRTVDLIADVFNGSFIPYDERFAEIRGHAFSFIVSKKWGF